MFTGLVEETGKISSIKKSHGLSLEISASRLLSDIKIGDSIAVNGVCLTVVKLSHKSFVVDVSNATKIKTTFGQIKLGQEVNLERALKLNDRLGGHFVLGHVNNTSNILDINISGNSRLISFKMPEELKNCIIKEGSLTIDGVSLTVAGVSAKYFVCSIIPHTWNNTNLHNRKTGDLVNIEADILSKYAEGFINKTNANENTLNEEWLLKLGY